MNRKVWVLVHTGSYDGPVYENRVFSSEESAIKALNFTPYDWCYYELVETEVEE